MLSSVKAMLIGGKNSEGAKKKNKRKAKALGTNASSKKLTGDDGHKKTKGREYPRIEHLNYKVSRRELRMNQLLKSSQRVVEGMKVLCQIIAIQPLSLIVSLPSQLFGHIPITHISTQLTKRLESMEKESEDSMDIDDEEQDSLRVPGLFEIFQIGQYVRAVVTAVRPAGVTTGHIIGLRRKLDEVERACQRIELSLVPEKINAGVAKGDLAPGFVRASVLSVISNSQH